MATPTTAGELFDLIDTYKREIQTVEQLIVDKETHLEFLYGVIKANLEQGDFEAAKGIRIEVQEVKDLIFNKQAELQNLVEGKSLTGYENYANLYVDEYNRQVQPYLDKFNGELKDNVLAAKQAYIAALYAVRVDRAMTNDVRVDISGELRNLEEFTGKKLNSKLPTLNFDDIHDDVIYEGMYSKTYRAGILGMTEDEQRYHVYGRVTDNVKRLISAGIIVSLSAPEVGGDYGLKE